MTRKIIKYKQNHQLKVRICLIIVELIVSVMYSKSKLLFVAPVAVTTAKKSVVPPSSLLANKKTKESSSSDSSDDDHKKKQPPAKVAPVTTTKKATKSSSSSSSDSDALPSANKKQPSTPSTKGKLFIHLSFL